MTSVPRRSLLALAAAAVAGVGALVVRRGTTAQEVPKAGRYAYGDDPSQFAELHLPPDGQDIRGVVVIVHGGYWRSTYGSELGVPLAEDLGGRGYACSISRATTVGGTKGASP